MSTKLGARGFSLLEAVAALALLALSLPPILSAFGDTVSRAAKADDRLNTFRRARDLVTLTVAQFRGEKEVRSGSDTDLRWEIRAEPLRLVARDEGGSSDPLPVEVSVIVRSRLGSEARLDTLFLFGGRAQR